MRVVLYGGNGWIGLQLQEELKKREIPFVLAASRVGRHTDEEASGGGCFQSNLCVNQFIYCKTKNKCKSLNFDVRGGVRKVLLFFW